MRALISVLTDTLSVRGALALVVAQLCGTLGQTDVTRGAKPTRVTETALADMVNPVVTLLINIISRGTAGQVWLRTGLSCD